MRRHQSILWSRIRTKTVKQWYKFSRTGKAAETVMSKTFMSFRLRKIQINHCLAVTTLHKEQSRWMTTR